MASNSRKVGRVNLSGSILMIELFLMAGTLGQFFNGLWLVELVVTITSGLFKMTDSSVTAALKGSKSAKTFFNPHTATASDIQCFPLTVKMGLSDI